MAHRNHGWTRIFSGSGKWHAEPTELTEKGDIKRDNICEICEICVGFKAKVRPGIRR